MNDDDSSEWMNLQDNPDRVAARDRISRQKERSKALAREYMHRRAQARALALKQASPTVLQALSELKEIASSQQRRNDARALETIEMP